MANQTATRKSQELIKAATVNRVSDKQGQVLGYLVKSNSNDDYYMVTGSKVNGKCSYFCNCKAGANAFRNCKDGKCCHVKAVIEVVEAKHELGKEAEIARASAYLDFKSKYAVREQPVSTPVVSQVLDGVFTESHKAMLAEHHRMYDGRNDADEAYAERYRRQVRQSEEEQNARCNREMFYDDRF